MEVRVRKEFQSYLDSIYNHLADLNQLVWNLQYIPDISLTDGEKCAIERFNESCRDVLFQVQKTDPLDTPSPYHCQSVESMLEDLRFNVRVLSDPLINCCEELYKQYYKEIQPIVSRLETILREKHR